jgi:DNA polymerase I
MRKIVIQTEEDFDEVCGLLSQEEYIAIDTETSWTDLYHERYCLGVSCYLPSVDIGIYLPLNHKDGQNFPATPEHLAAFSRSCSAGCAVYHNAKFDRTVLERAGIHLIGPWHDTLLIHYLINENEEQGLKPLACRYIDPKANEEQTIVKGLRNAFTWEGIPTGIMAEYAIKDTYLTWKLFELFYPSLCNNGLSKVLEREYRFSTALQILERSGIQIDPVEAQRQSERCTVRMKEIVAELGFDPAKRNQLLPKLFGMPPDGLGLKPVAYGKPTKTFPMGAPAVGVDELNTYSHPIVGLILEYRRLQKAQSTWYDGWREVIDDNHRIHPTYRQEGTVTGRLSCSSPNMQQVPRDTVNNPVKRLLRAKSGMDLWEFDYSQVELRLASVYANESRMLEVFRNAGDPHTAVAEAIGVDRHVGKTINFLILYGGGVNKLFEVLDNQKANYTWDQCEAFMKAFHETYPGFKKIMWKTAKISETRGYIQYWTGRKRRMLEYEHHKAFNSLIQGGAAEIMKDTMLMFYESCMPEIEIVATVHDALWIEVPKNRPDLLDKIQATMEWPEQDFGIPFPVDRKLLYGN